MELFSFIEKFGRYVQKMRKIKYILLKNRKNSIGRINEFNGGVNN